MKIRTVSKKILYSLPQPLRRSVVLSREWWWRKIMESWEKSYYPNLPKLKNRTGPIKNILIYQIAGLSHGGTEKNLQLIANGLAEKYQVFFMYGDKDVEPNRKESLQSNIVMIPFSYTENGVKVPHRLLEAKPHIKKVIVDYDIDIIITATPGYAHYPWNIITEIPIIISNVFGAPSLQKNIVATVFMSDTVRKFAEHWTGPRKSHHTKLLPIGSLPPENIANLGKDLRKRLDIPEDDFVFGRIGRNDDSIFDPIGIRAWQKIADKHPYSHYLIMSPPPILVKIVESEKIPRVHFLPPSGREIDVWSFHGAIDSMAHFRFDGETSGVAIAESLFVGNPIISHRSPIWNAHLGYLSGGIHARIADINNVDEYAAFMEEFITIKNTDKSLWEEQRSIARKCGEENFSPTTYLEYYKDLLSHL